MPVIVFNCSRVFVRQRELDTLHMWMTEDNFLRAIASCTLHMHSGGLSTSLFLIISGPSSVLYFYMVRMVFMSHLIYATLYLSLTEFSITAPILKPFCFDINFTVLKV